MEALAEQYAQLEPGGEKEHVLEMCKLLLAYHTSNEKFEVSLGLLESLRAGGGGGDEDLLNFALLFYDRSEDFNSMLPLYDDLEKLHPNLATQIQRARLNVHILAEEYEEASAIIQRLSSRGASSSVVLAGIQQLQRAGQMEHARDLLEDFAHSSEDAP